MKNKLDLTKYTNKAFVQLIKDNREFCTAIATKKEWNEILAVLDKLNIIYSESQINALKEKYWN